MIIVQKIQTHWTKASRGIPNSKLRNSVPRRLELPYIENDAAIFVHEVKATEDNGFKLESETLAIPNPKKYWSFEFTESGNRLNVFFRYSYHEHGAPNRGGVRRNLINLSKGETASFHINGRFTYYSGQWYRQYFVNIGYGVSETDVFLSKPFNRHVSKMVNLF